ncbi:unnamed protein product [Danaus chrysippus]|uniref:Lysozyme n=1 Tax=Danaus chrysippus TaxID=151541 RepID=A0A8J2QSX0_9NEOP|nr:unnamed protein product [Danaus chrysippus]
MSDRTRKCCHRNTSAHVVKTPRKQYYGLFQIGSEWCKEGKKGGKCDIACESLLDDDIRDDCACAYKIFEDEGFKYWTKWESRCKGERLPDIENKIIIHFKFQMSGLATSSQGFARTNEKNIKKTEKASDTDVTTL